MYFETYAATLDLLSDTSGDPQVVVYKAGMVYRLPVSLISSLLLFPVFINASGSNQTYSLPASGQVMVFRTDATTHDVTISPSVGGQTVDFQPFINLTQQGDSVRLVFDSGTNNWYRG